MERPTKLQLPSLNTSMQAPPQGVPPRPLSNPQPYPHHYQQPAQPQDQSQAPYPTQPSVQSRVQPHQMYCGNAPSQHQYASGSEVQWGAQRAAYLQKAMEAMPSKAVPPNDQFDAQNHPPDGRFHQERINPNIERVNQENLVQQLKMELQRKNCQINSLERDLRTEKDERIKQLVVMQNFHAIEHRLTGIESLLIDPPNGGGAKPKNLQEQVWEASDQRRKRVATSFDDAATISTDTESLGTEIEAQPTDVANVGSKRKAGEDEQAWIRSDQGWRSRNQ